MDDSHHFLTPGTCVVDLGAAPGSWTQVSVQRTNALLSGKFLSRAKRITWFKQQECNKDVIVGHNDFRKLRNLINNL